MNIVLFQPDEIDGPIARSDPRVRHILDVLRRRVGDATDVGLVNGPRGKAVLRSLDHRLVEFEFVWGEEPEPLLPIELIVGLSRPQTCRKILQEATSLGVQRIVFALTQRGEPSYATSKLWTTGQWQRWVQAGVEQAFTTRFPLVQFGVTLNDAVNDAIGEPAGRICLDNYESTTSLGCFLRDGKMECQSDAFRIVLAVGSERGWTGPERDLFRGNRFTMVDLGHRPQRSETATIAAISILQAFLS